MLCCIVGRACFVWCNIIFTIIKYYIVFSVGENDNAGDEVSSGRVLRNGRVIVGTGRRFRIPAEFVYFSIRLS